MYRLTYMGDHEERPRIHWHTPGFRWFRQCVCTFPVSFMKTFWILYYPRRHGIRRCDRVVSTCNFSLPSQTAHSYPSEITPQGKKKTKLAQTLLNGNNICMVCTVAHNMQRKRLLMVHMPCCLQLIPGSAGPEESWCLYVLQLVVTTAFRLIHGGQIAQSQGCRRRPV